MGIKNTLTSFGWMARTLHWVVALLIVSLLIVGQIFKDMPRGDGKSELMALHMSVGLIVLLLMVLRLVWRWLNPAPGHPPATPVWQALVAYWTHWLLYLLVFGQLITGILTRATVAPIPFFGLDITLPIERNRELHGQFEDLHILGWQVLMVVVVVHILAAVYHHWVRKDDVLMRMTTGTSDSGND